MQQSIWKCRLLKWGHFAPGEMSLEIYVFRLTHPIDIILFRHLLACGIPVIEKPLLIYQSLDPLATDI